VPVLNRSLEIWGKTTVLNLGLASASDELLFGDLGKTTVLLLGKSTFLVKCSSIPISNMLI
jgi:hypothetical protein